MARVCMGQHRTKGAFPSILPWGPCLHGRSVPSTDKMDWNKGNSCLVALGFFGFSSCCLSWKGAVILRDKMLPLWYKKCYPCVYERQAWQVEQPVPVEVLLLCFRQQTWLTAILLSFKLEDLLSRVTWFFLLLVPCSFHQKLSALLVLRA